MMAGLQTSDDYLEMWHGYLGFLKRNLLSNYENETQDKKDAIAEEIRESFQKAINQLFDCKLKILLVFKIFKFRLSLKLKPN